MLLASVMHIMGQTTTLDLTFTAVESVAYVQLDSIKVMNRTHWDWGDTVIYWPDTTVTMEITPGDLLLYVGYSTGLPQGILPAEQDVQKFLLSQSCPNPVFEQCFLSMNIPDPGKVVIVISDIRGKVVCSAERFMYKGSHLFRFIPGDASVYLLSARWNDRERTIKIIHADPEPGQSCRLDDAGVGNADNSLNKPMISTDLVMKESGILDSPVTNKSYTFQFATNIPCLGTPTVEYEGQVYNTIQIFSQCWLKENLNVGTMIPGSQNQSNNGVIEKYCYNDEYDNCTKYGGLYQWNEMMQYSTQQGVQGICPPGWHVPMDEEWKVLEGAVDSQYGIGDPEWDKWGDRGTEAGTNLKSISGWYLGGNGADLFGFSGLPGGVRNNYGFFSSNSGSGIWWESTEFNSHFAWCRSLYYDGPGVNRYINFKEFGFSVRCLRDD